MASMQAEVIIIGAGIAGLATAYHLAALGCKGVWVLDREAVPGFYASSHNAGIARQLTGRAAHTALTVQGRQCLERAGLLTSTGGLLLGVSSESLNPLEMEAREVGLVARRGTGCPLPGLVACEHLTIPSDGVIDVDGMLHYCLSGARAGGVHMAFGQEVLSLAPTGGGWEVVTSRGRYFAKHVVNGAGAWAGPLGRMAGALNLAFQPLRRHLIWSKTPAYSASSPWAWWVDRLLYLRPESGGLLLCACEETLVTPPLTGLQPADDEDVLGLLHERLQELAPHWVDREVTRLWCGLRTFAPDRQFVLGEDPHQPRFHWAAGLGGHGMTSGLAVGECVARALLELSEVPLSLSAARFA